MAKALAPLTSTAALTAASAPALGKINRYNATAGALTVALPVLSGLADGAVVAVQKDDADVSANTVTVTAAGSDVIDAASTSVVLRMSGSLRTLQVVTIGGVKSWRTVSSYDPLPSLDARFTAASPTKRTRVTIGSDLSGSINLFTEYLPSIILPQYPDVKRWRLVFANRQFGGAITGPFALSDIRKGTPLITAQGEFQGNFTAAPTLAVAAPTPPTDGSDFSTAWVDGPPPPAVTFAVTCAAGQAIAYGSNGYQHMRYDTGSAAQVGSAVRTGGGVDVGAILDVRLEIEHTSGAEHVPVFGDSMTSGVMDDGNLRSAVVSPLNSWPMMAGERNKAIVTVASTAGIALGDILDLNHWAYKRFDFVTTPPDAFIIAHALNSISAGVSLTTFKGHMNTVIGNLRTFNPKRIMLATAIPVPYYKAGAILTGVPTGTTQVTTDIAYASGEVLDIGFGTAGYEQRTTAAASTVAADGSWVTTFTAATAKPHPALTTIQLPLESRRQEYNAWLRRGPFGCMVIDHDLCLRDSRGPSLGSPDRSYWGAGAVHPGRAAYRVMASAVML